MKNPMSEKWLTAGGVGLAFILAAFEASAGTQCGLTVEDPVFAGSFEAPKSAESMGMSMKGSRPLKFEIRYLQPSLNGAQPVGMITLGKTCLALCSVESLDTDENFEPQRLQINCQSALLSSLSKRGELRWSDRTHSTVELRFGTWLEGYVTTQLKVNVDRYSQTMRATLAGAR